MEDEVNLVTRGQYIEMLIDASFKDAAEIEVGFLSWCEHESAKVGVGEYICMCSRKAVLRDLRRETQ